MAILHVSHSLAMFVTARLIQGCAGALVVVAAFSLINDSVPQEHLGQIIGYLGSAIASGFLLGPFLGGLVYHTGGYDAVFWVAYAIIALDLAMRVVMIEKRVAAQWAPIPDGDLESDAQPVDGPAFSEHELRAAGEGFILFRILKQRRVLISSWALLVQGILLSAFDAVCSYPGPTSS